MSYLGTVPVTGRWVGGVPLTPLAANLATMFVYVYGRWITVDTVVYYRTV
jgi:hypothetical protein